MITLRFGQKSAILESIQHSLCIFGSLTRFIFDFFLVKLTRFNFGKNYMKLQQLGKSTQFSMAEVLKVYPCPHFIQKRNAESTGVAAIMHF